MRSYTRYTQTQANNNNDYNNKRKKERKERKERKRKIQANVIQKHKKNTKGKTTMYSATNQQVQDRQFQFAGY